MTAKSAFTPKASLTEAPTNLKEAIDWVLRVTGKDGKKNEKPTAPKAPAGKDPAPHCLCYLAKAVKDLLYDAKDPGSPGPSTERYWDGIFLPEEQSIVLPVLTDLGLVNSDSTTSTCAGGTEVIGTLIDQLALGLQKWVGWQEDDECCLKGTDGIGKKCSIRHDCDKCSIKVEDAKNRCYFSAYQGKYRSFVDNRVLYGATNRYLWTSISSDSTKVHLLARIFLGSVCLIWSGLSQLGFLTGKGGDRWSQSSLHDIEDPTNVGLGSFMAAMGYDLDRLNKDKGGEHVWKILSRQNNGKNRIPWKEFTKESAEKKSVADYYSSIYQKAEEAGKEALKNKKTESICEQYPLLVLHILATGYFRAGSAGTKNVTPASAEKKKDVDSTSKKPRHPRTIREILYWLSALPYSQGYKELVDRMEGKMKDLLPKDEKETQQKDEKNILELYNEGYKKTELKKGCINHYLMAACGYCPLVLIGIQGTIEKEVEKTPAGQKKAEMCPNNGKSAEDKKDCNKTDGLKKAGKVCYGGYHLEVSQFGPLHGMYANGLFGFEMDMSSAQCLDQLRVYVYHCFYQLYFLRKQCGTGVVNAGGKGVALGWRSCRYGKGVNWSAITWLCSTGSAGSNGKDCQCKDSVSPSSPLMTFLCDTLKKMHCPTTTGKDVGSVDTNPYPEINEHFEAKDTISPKHFGEPPMHCPVPMGWSMDKENHFKDLNTGSHKTENLTTGASHPSHLVATVVTWTHPVVGKDQKYPAHCTGKTISYLLEYFCDPDKCHGTLVVLLRLLACITPTVPRTLGDLFGFYYYIVNMVHGGVGYIGGISENQGVEKFTKALEKEAGNVIMGLGRKDSIKHALSSWGGNECDKKPLKCLMKCSGYTCTPYLSPLSGQQYGQLSPLMAGTYLSWLVYLIEKFEDGLDKLRDDYRNIQCKTDGCSSGKGGAAVTECGNGKCQAGNHGDKTNCCGCQSIVSCSGVLPVLYKYGFGYGNVTELHKPQGQKKCHDFLGTLDGVISSEKFSALTNSINQLIYTTRLPWIFVLTLAWLAAALYLAFGAIWPLDWTHMRSHCRGWFTKGSGSTPWEILMVGKKKGRGILEFFGGK